MTHDATFEDAPRVHRAHELDVPVDPASLAVHADSSSHFSWCRTRMAMERTLLAWVRSATGLVGFGFTIVQFFERVGSFTGARPALEPHAARLFGLAMMFAGTTALALALLQYRLMRKHLWSDAFRPIAGIADEQKHLNPSVFVAVVLLLVSIWATCAVMFRLVP